jgi:cobalt-zinc-cadmium efflux system outer membrane protein
LERRGILAVLVTIMLCASEARAEDGACRVVNRANVGACAVAASAAVRAEREGVAAAAGRRRAADPWFPSSPTLAIGAAQRHEEGGGRDAWNYHASLSQELELAGQRASRRRAADADIDARTNDATAVARRVAASAYVAYFDALAARDAIVVARRLESVSADVAKVTRARADAGVASALDAEVADAAAVRLVQARLASERAERTALASLATLLGRDAAQPIAVEGELDPIANVDAIVASQRRERPEVRAFRDEQRVFASRAEAFRRARFPSLTLQIFAENDGFNERVLGAGLSLPLPLPQPFGRTYEGEAAEAEALARQAELRAEQTRREHDGALAAAIASFEAARAEVALYGGDRIPRTEKLLADVAREIETGRLGVRDAIVAQRELVDVLRGRVEARRALSLASVDLAYAAGVALEAGQR